MNSTHLRITFRPQNFRVGWLFLAVLLMACGGPGVPPEVQALTEYEKGLEFKDRGSMQAAFEAFDAAIKLDSGMAEAYAERGHLALLFDNRVQALADVNRAISLDANLATAYNYKGVLMADTGNYDDAIINYSKAIELDSSMDEAYFNRARVYFETQDLDAALKDISSAIEISPRSAGMYMTRGRINVLAGNVTEATLDFEQVIALTQDEVLVNEARRMLALLR